MLDNCNISDNGIIGLASNLPKLEFLSVGKGWCLYLEANTFEVVDRKQLGYLLPVACVIYI